MPSETVTVCVTGAADRLTLLDADLTADGAFDAAVYGCTYVLHTASPYALDARDPQRELGLELRPIETTIADTMADLARWGHLSSR